MERIETPYYLNEMGKHSGSVWELDKVNVINVQLQLGETLPEHKVDAQVIVIVRKGRVTFTVNGRAVELTPQHLLYLEPGELHDVKAEEVSDFILVQVRN